MAMADSNKVVVSVLRRKLLGNEAAPSPLKKVEDILSKNHPSLQVTVTSVECSTIDSKHLKVFTIYGSTNHVKDVALKRPTNLSKGLWPSGIHESRHRLQNNSAHILHISGWWNSRKFLLVN